MGDTTKPYKKFLERIIRRVQLRSENEGRFYQERQYLDCIFYSIGAEDVEAEIIDEALSRYDEKVLRMGTEMAESKRATESYEVAGALLKEVIDSAWENLKEKWKTNG